MIDRSGSGPSSTDPATLTAHLSDLARQQLDGLRTALDIRLADLEAVLADPSRGESLEGLIVDLARVATTEAQVAASKACLAEKLKAEAAIAQATKAAEAGGAQQRAVEQQLRQTVEERERRIATLESESRIARRSLDEQVAAAVAVEHEAAAERDRALLEARAQLETERAKNADMRRSAQRADGLAATLDTERAAAQAAQQKLTTQLAHAKETSAAHERAHAESTSQLQAERIAAAELRVARLRAEELLRTRDHEHAQARTEHEQLAAETAREREALAGLRRTLSDTQGQLVAERASSAELRGAVDHAEQRLASVASDNARTLAAQEVLQADLALARAEAKGLQAEVAAARTRVAELEAKLAEQMSLAALAAQDATAASSTPRAARVAASSPTGSGTAEEAWTPLRLADRYLFREPIDVHVNGEPGLLVDLSTTGCQVLARSVLKPNQGIRVLLPTEMSSIICIGKVVWARLELSSPGRPLEYRAGIQFSKPNQAAIEAFAVRRART